MSHSPKRRRSGRRALALARYVLTRDHHTCWLCGHPGADTADHLLPVDTHPHLEFDPTNMRAAHGTKRTIEQHGYTCQGNYGRGKRPAKPEPSRPWK